MTKRILAGALSLALAAGLLAGCGGSASSAPASSDASPAPQATDTPAPAAAAEADHNILTGSAHSGAQPRPIAVMLNNRESGTSGAYAPPIWWWRPCSRAKPAP